MKRRKNPCPWWKRHDWRRTAYDGFITVSETCTRCGLIKIFNGALDETTYYKPLAEVGLTEENTEKEQNR